MAKPTDQRVNKNLVIPGDQPLIDPGASDASADHSYDTIEELRVERGLAAAQQSQQSDEPPSGRDLRALTGQSDQGLIEDQKLHAWEAQQGREVPQAQTGEDTAIIGAVDADAVEAAREARFTDLENMHEANADDVQITGDPPSHDY
jgi:hypothetical protein